jgi:hypothetical protein
MGDKQEMLRWLGQEKNLFTKMMATAGAERTSLLARDDRGFNGPRRSHS